MKKHLKTSIAALIGVALGGAALGGAAIAAGWPSQPVLFVVAGQPGGGADVQARAIIAAIDRAKIIDQPAAVLNKGGGGSQEPFTFVAGKKGNPSLPAWRPPPST